MSDDHQVPPPPPEGDDESAGSPGPAGQTPRAYETGAAAWTQFRSWPLWLQALLWLFVWPALAALFAARTERLGSAAMPVALAVLLFGGLVWWPPMLTSNDGTQSNRPVAAPTATPTPVEEPTASDTATPTPEPTATDDPGTHTSTADGDLEVHFVDVGQGDATLLRTADTAVLIDAGRHNGTDVVPYLRSVGVEHLDVVAVTHPHADHIGQFDRVMDALPVEEVWWSGTSHTTQTFERAVAALESSDAAYEEPRAGDATTVGGLLFEFVNPPAGGVSRDLHDASLAFRVTWGQTRLLFTGDAETATEQRMVRDHPDWLDVDIYQVGHHGSDTSTPTAVLDAMTPAVAVYSAGSGNSYGHPHPQVIDRLTAAGVEVHGTDVHGTVVITTDGDSWSVATGRNPGTDAEPPPTPPPAPAAPPPPEPPPAASPDCQPGQVDINTAAVEDLRQIIHIGPDRAQQIVVLRPFASVDELTRVSGIAAARLEDIKRQGVACA